MRHLGQHEGLVRRVVTRAPTLALGRALATVAATELLLVALVEDT